MKILKKIFSYIAGFALLLFGIFFALKNKKKTKVETETQHFENDNSQKAENEIDDIDNTINNLP